MLIPRVEQGPLVPPRYVQMMLRWFALSTWHRATRQTGITGFGASEGPVDPHTDRVGDDNYVVGWIVTSYGHMLHTDSHPEGLPLLDGSVYCLDPMDRHWTTAKPYSLLQFFWTAMPRVLPFHVGSIIRVLSEDLDARDRAGALP